MAAPLVRSVVWPASSRSRPVSLAKKRRPFQAISSRGESGETLNVPAAVPSLCQRYVCPLVGPGWRMK